MQITNRSEVANTNCYIFNEVPHLKFREHCGRRIKKTKSQQTRVYAVRWLSSRDDDRSCIHEISTTQLPRQNLYNDLTQHKKTEDFTRLHIYMKKWKSSMATESESQFSPGTRLLIGYPIPNSQPYGTSIFEQH